MLTQRSHQLRVVVAAAAILCICCGQSNAASPRHGADKRQIQETEERWRLAEVRRDTATLESLLTDDFLGISMTGQVNTKEAQISRLKNGKLLLDRLDLSDMRVKRIGMVAIVTSLVTAEGMNDGVPFTGVYRSTQVLKRLPSGVWKITSSEATRVPGGLAQR